MTSDVEKFTRLAEKVRRGQEIVSSGNLRDLRNRIGFSKGAMAELIGCSAITYVRWERGPVEHALWPHHAINIATVADQIDLIMKQLADENVVLARYRPLHVAAARYGIPQEVLLSRYREGGIEGLDLGILGLWLARDEGGHGK